MSKQVTKTNNDLSLIEKKIELRVMSLPDKDVVTVLEAFGGEGVLWREVKKRTSKTINILSIDVVKYKKVNLQGNNLKFLKTLDLSKFDIIDLDSYGSPSDQLDVLQKRGYKGIVHCTFIQSMLGRINTNILEACGYSKQMVDKCPTLFGKNGVSKILQYVNKLFGTTEVKIVSFGKKNYFYFVIS